MVVRFPLAPVLLDWKRKPHLYVLPGLQGLVHERIRQLESGLNLETEKEVEFSTVEDLGQVFYQAIVKVKK